MQVFMNSIVTVFTTSFNSCVDRIVDAVDKKLTHRIEVQTIEIFALSKRLDHFEKVNKELVAGTNWHPPQECQ